MVAAGYTVAFAASSLRPALLWAEVRSLSRQRAASSSNLLLAPQGGSPSLFIVGAFDKQGVTLPQSSQRPVW